LKDLGYKHRAIGRRISVQKDRKKQEQKWIWKIKLFGSKKDADLLVRAYYDEIYFFVYRQINGKR